MSDTQSAPVPIPPIGPVEKPAHSNNRPNNTQGGGGRGDYRGGRGRGGGSRGGQDRGGYDRERMDDDRDGSNRRKKPELQHYKPPGAFNTRRSDYNEGANNNSYHQRGGGGNNGEQHQRGGGADNGGGYNNSSDKYGNNESRKISSDHSDRGPRGGRGGGSGRNKNHYQGSNDVDNATEKVGQLFVDDNQRTGTGKRKNKKPEQPHYSAKKVGPNENIPEDASSGTKEGSIKDSGGPVVSKPPQQPAKPAGGQAADDTKSEGGGSNTGTARRNRNKNKSRSSGEKAISPVSKDSQGPSPKNIRSNDADERPPVPRQQNQAHGQHASGYGSRQNGYAESVDGESKPEDVVQHTGGYSHHEGGGRGRHSGSRNKARGGGHSSDRRSPSESGRNSSSRKSSPTGREPHQHRYQHDESNRSSVDRSFAYNDRRSPSIGSSSTGIGHGSLPRPSSPSRRGMAGHNSGALLGPRHQRSGFNRNAENSDWRFNREGSHEESASSSYQHQQQQLQTSQSYDRWGNDFRTGGRGGKAQQPKINIPPRFQRFQQQHHQQQQPHSYEDTYTEQPSQQQQQLPLQQQQPFRRRGSGRRSGDSDVERPWRRSSHSASDNGIEPESEQIERVEEVDEELSRVNDWSVEVGEEERMERTAGSVTPIISASTTAATAPGRGGIIRLPQAHQGPDSGSWRAAATANENQDANNPAWRGLQQHEAVQLRNAAGTFPTPLPGPGAPYWQNNRPPRFLYDHKNPNTPIPAPSYPSGSGAGVRASGANVVRFPVDPRFAHPPPVTAYRHPFPPMNQPPPSARPPHPSPHEARPIPPAMESIMRSRLMLQSMYQAGGPRLLAEKWDTDVAECRRNTLSAFKYLLETELVYCASNDVEFMIWQFCFYHLVETLKSLLPGDDTNAIHQTIVDLIDEGIEFYEAMLDTLDGKYGIGLDNFYDVLEPRSSDKMVRCVLVSAQKCLLCLGDLARYKEQVQESSNYGTARQYYQRASNIDTRNGRPFNQLAFLAQTTKRKFEAVYYNMRCLLTLSPIPSSRECLTLIFEEVRRKWEATEKKRMEEREVKRRNVNKEKEVDGSSSSVRGTKLRKEIWIRPEGGRRLHRTTSAREDDVANRLEEETALKELATSDLNRRFNNSFLYLIGKLFTNINVDTFSMASDILLQEFRVLVSRTPLPIDAKRLVQIMALNMFIIDFTKVKGQDSQNYRTVAQNSALQLAFGMFGVLVERCNVLLGTFIPKLDMSNNANGDGPQSSIFSEEDLPTLLSAVKVWCDWILGNNDIWYPVVTPEPFKQLAQLATHLEKLKPLMRPALATLLKEEVLISLSNRDEFEMVKLEEDSLLCGFNPWFRGLDWKHYRRYAPKSIPSTLAQDVRRLDAINFCIEFLEGHEPPIFKWSPQDNAHLSLVENGTTENKNVFLNKLTSTDEISRLIEKGADILDESYSDEDGDLDNKFSDILSVQNIEIDDIVRLKHRKDELERRHKQEEESRRIRNQILSEHVSVLLEICPKILVPDTNCFVDHLLDLGRLSSVGTYQLRVPVVVLNELDGLAKGTLRNQVYQNKYSSPEHAVMVAENAKRALSWLKDRPSNTKCVTSRGTVLASLAVKTEEDSLIDGKTNDDLILDVCLNLATASTKDHMNERRERDLRVVARDIVLLTDDRNLKLKAYTCDVPVNTMPDFIRWAFAPTASN